MERTDPATIDRWVTRLTDGPYRERDAAWRELQREDPQRFAAGLASRLDTHPDLAWAGLDAVVRHWIGPMSRDRASPPWRFATPLALALKTECRERLFRLETGDFYERTRFVALAPLLAASPDADYPAAKGALERVLATLRHDSADQAFTTLRVYFRFDAADPRQSPE